MAEVKIKDTALQKAAEEGVDEFVKVFIDSTLDAIGGQLTTDSMAELNSDQITLLAWYFLHGEMMDGGMIQLIHNGFGGFIFRNPTDKAFKKWGLVELGKLINKAHYFYKKAAPEVEQDMSDEDFMALYEKYPEFDDFDDAFVENEEEWTSKVAYYIDEHIDNFASIIEE